MNLVSWNSAIQLRRRADHRSSAADKLWSEVARPACFTDLVGNEEAIGAIARWFRRASEDQEKSSCLFVHGESGTGKSTAVGLVAKRFAFEAVTTYADRSRTPARLEGVVREASVHGSRGVVVLDDFEIFLSETTSLRVLSKLLRQLLSPSTSNGSRTRCLFVVISNSTHKLFGSLQDISTVVAFRRLEQREMFRVLSRLSARVSKHSYIPPMAVFLSSVTSAGTITQAIQQLQLLYAGNTLAAFVSRPRGKKQKVSSEGNNRDCISYLWSDLYTDKILEHLLDEKFQADRVLSRLMEFERGRLDIVGRQLHDEYPKRVASVGQLRRVAEAISMADTNRMENHEDGLYDGENKEVWSSCDMLYVASVANGVQAIKGQEARDRCWSRKPRARLMMARQDLIF